MFDLTDRTALVTGASRGIGEAIARALAARGAKVVLTARSADKLARVAEEIEQAGGEALPFELDVAAPEAVADRLKQLPESFSEIDVLVNNAGITDDNLLARMTIQQWELVLTTNLTGTYAVTKALCRGMLKRRWGRVIIVSSVVGLMGNAGQTNYAAAKAGLVGFAKSLARELASRNVTVNVIAPGFIRTEMTAGLSEETRAELERSIPLGRLGTVEDIAAATVYLASEEARYVTGHVLNVSGGMYI